MKILHTISSIDLFSGGPSKSVTDLAHHLTFGGCDVTIFTNVSENPYRIESSNSKVKFKFNESKLFKGPFGRFVDVEDFHIFHGHGIWEMPVHYMSEAARKRNIPYIISPRGMLESWSVSQKRIKKQLAMFLYQKTDIDNAACIHATSQMEAENIRKLGFKNPIAIIPNIIDVPEFNSPIKEKIKKNKILFLSRIHVKKGVETLIEAWDQIPRDTRQNWVIELVGNGDSVYIERLINIIKGLNLEQEIFYLGARFGDDKNKCYDEADLFVLPTYSENFGLVIGEALIFGIPVITTKGTPWQELERYNAGWWVDIGIEPLKIALMEAMSLNKDKLHDMGQNGRRLVLEKFNGESVSRHMRELYEWVLQIGDKPDFVYD